MNGGDALVARILASSYFRNSPRLCELLKFLIQETAEGRGDQLHEQVIGCNVFGRQPGYSSNDDNIVRVQMRQLRLKLQAYFSERGAAEPVLLTIPKGSYVPVFSAHVVEGLGYEVQPPDAAPPGSGNPAAHRRRPFLVLAIALAALAGVSLLAALVRHPEAAPDADPLFARLFDAAHPTHIVVADSCFELVQSLTGKSLSIDQYMRRDVSPIYEGASPDMRKAIERLLSRQFTSIVDSSVAATILRLSEERGPRVAIKYARDLQLRDLKMAHVVLLGSKRSNPWVQLFEPHMNFTIEQEAGAPVIRNRSPRRGEPSIYQGGSASGVAEGYSVVAFLPNLNRDGNVLIIAGTTMNATEAAGEFITNPARSAAFLQSLSAESRSSGVPYFEALLKTSSMAGVAKAGSLVTHRLIPPGQ